MSDHLVRATAADGYIRAFAVSSKELLQEATGRHGLSPVTAAALGRAMSAALMMGTDLKGEGSLMTLQFVTDGPMGGMTVTADNEGHVKGFVGAPDLMLPLNDKGKLDVGGAVGKGILHVMKDTGMGEPYSTEVEIVTGEIAEDINYYFASSEQIPSAVALGVLVDPSDMSIAESGGYILQLTPGCPDEIAAELEEICKGAKPVTAMLKDGMSPEEMLKVLLSKWDVRINETMPVSFACNCSRERVQKALLAMGSGQLGSMIDDGKDVTLTCHFCQSTYTFTIEELRELLAAAEAKSRS